MKKQVGNKLRGSAGFTLVELVVVIAIIGILAGVGTVGYSGYIKRTNEGLDETLYRNIIYAGEIGKYENPGVTGRVMVYKDAPAEVGSSSDGDEIIEQWMENAFGADWPETVKYRTDKYANSSYATIILPAMEITLDETHKQLLDDFRKSNLDGHEVELANICNGISNAFATLAADHSKLDALKALVPEATFNSMLEELGVAEADYNHPENWSPETRTQFANKMVLYVAQKAGDMNTTEKLDSYLTTLKGDGTSGPSSPMQLATAGGGNPTAPELALALGVTTSYANSKYASKEIKNAYADATADGDVDYGKLLGLMNKMTDETEKGNYQKYLDDTDKGAKADMKAYLGALQVISESQDKYKVDFDISSSNAFNNDQTLALLQAVLNSGK